LPDNLPKVRLTMNDRLRASNADPPGRRERASALHQDGSLERRYRRLLAFYPARYRRVHEEEMLAVLLTAPPAGKRRPGLTEAADLIAGALRVWCQPSRGGTAGWRRALALISAVTLLGLLAGIAVAAAKSPRPEVAAAVRIQPVVPGEAYANNQLIRERAEVGMGPAISLKALESQVQIRRASSRIVIISAPLTAEATRAVGAVAQSYVAYVSGKDIPGGSGKMHPVLLYVDSVAPRMSLVADVLDTGGLGALSGALVGAIGAVALSLPSRRFRTT
jgi:hypothetical protein